ncbi:MAG: ABC transporter substrate-binding protein [Fretibacterium sp.]|nr:ABC transporter substrate-binding protein [Fretibacterium sp.]
MTGRILRVLAFSLFLLSALLAGVSGGAERIVSLYPGHTDNVAALGGAALLVGLSENEDPELLSAFPGLSDLPRLSPKTGAEAVLALKPDLVLSRSLVDRMNPNLTEVLRRAGVQVEVLDPPGWDDFPDYLRKLAALTGLDHEAGVRRLEHVRSELAAEAGHRGASAGQSGPKRVFVEATARELHTCSPGSWAAHMVELAGGANAAGAAAPLREGSALAPWGLERVLRTLAEGLDVYLVQQGVMNASTSADVRARSWASALDRSGARVAEIPESFLSRPSLLGLERGGRMLLDIFYGE